MNKKILFLLFLIIPTATAYFIGEEIDGVANKYKGYDEILLNITKTEYRGETYYWVDYSKNLQYSSSILLDKKGNTVEDKQKIFFFALAKIINQNYPKQGVENWKIFSENYERVSGSLPGNLSTDAKQISRLFAESATHMEKSIDNYSPDSAEKYFETNKKIIDLMSESYQRAKKENRSQLTEEYENSLTAIHPQLVDERKNIAQGADYIAETASLRVAEEKNRQGTETIIYAATAVLGIGIAAAIFLKKKNKI